MAEYLEKEKIKQYIRDFCNGLISDGRQFDSVDDCVLLNQMIDFAPADVVVVRCKDCKHYVARYCTRDINGRTNMFLMSEDDFCNHGKRKVNQDG